MFIVFEQFQSLLVGLFISKTITLLAIIYDLNRRGLITLSVNRKVIARMFDYGKWVFITSLAGPLMVNLDKVIVTRMVGIEISSAYIMSSELVNRLSIFPQALGKYLFPSFTEDFAKGDKSSFRGSVVSAWLLNLPISAVVFFWGGDIISLWFGEDGTKNFDLILKVLSIGFLFNALAQVPYASLHAKALTRTTAFIHLFELFLFIPVLIYSVIWFDIIGAAIAWSARAIIDCWILFLADKNLMRTVIKRGRP